MTVPALLTLATLIGVLALLARGRSPDLVLVGSVVFLTITGVITPTQAFTGFANTGMLTVAALFIVAAGLRETGAVTMLSMQVLGRPRTPRAATFRLVPPVVATSAFLNNTTIVAALLPAINDWSRRSQLPASKLLLPLSYASLLGGVCTMVGTSTNLVVAGLLAKAVADGNTAVHEPGMFEISWVGLPVALVGAALLVLLGPALLPDRRPGVSLAADPREFTMEMVVPAGSRVIGRSIEQAGLRHLPGAYLMEIDRDGRVLPAVEAAEVLRGGDRLVFVGDVTAMVDLQRFPGLAAATDQVFKLAGQRDQRILVEAVVSPRNRLRGQTIRDGRFRSVYQAAVIAVARHGERLQQRIGDIRLRPGDVLLLEAHPDFVDLHRSRSDFYLVSAVDGATPPRLERAGVALGLLISMVTVAALDIVPTVIAAFLAAGGMVLTRCVTSDEARRSVDWQVVVAIGASFGLGEALQASGLADAIASGVVSVGATNAMLALAVTYVAAAVLTELITNNAAAVLMFPLALSVADKVHAQPMPFVFAVMIAASASFLTPIGYQTNLMVYGPGGYRLSDYIRLGLPLSVATAATAIVLIPRFWPL